MRTILGLTLLWFLAWPAAACARESKPPPIDARAWILLDASDGARLAADHPDASRAMASTTKLMTAYLSLRELPLRKRLVAPAYHPIPGESLLGLDPGERMSTRDLLYGLLLPSGNDAAATLAQGAAGTTARFIAEMNRTARRLGLDETSYANPIGLDQPGNHSSPRDLASLALRLRRERLFREIVDTPRTTLRTGDHPRTIVNHNDLVGRVPWVNGVKTGYTLDAGYVLVGSGTRKGVTLLSVVMGAPSMQARDQDTVALLDYGFSLYSRRTVVPAGKRLAHSEVTDGEGPVELIAAHAVRATLRRGEHVEVERRLASDRVAPIRRGEQIGSATVIVDGRPVGRTPLVARHAVPIASDSLLENADDALPGPRAVVWGAALVALGAIAAAVAALVRRRRGS